MVPWPAFVAAPLAIFAPAAHAAVYLSVEQAQQAIFPGARFTVEALASPDAAHRQLWRVSQGGWFIVDAVFGKHELITYAVGLGADGSVRGVEILEYLESYGYQIRDPAWRRQFAGKTARDPLKLDQDIRNISGATLSCRHVTDGIKRLLGFYESALKQR
ncbi:MAG: FMN-binding protein [Betaproteobacteria bacterium]|nr:MAG: FMN-binding protein [Betaproteobacteria bacterium]TMI01920.1 MAG: FMN-binding protein [Betaproteobacteria bacterium]TMI09541.1 MAG: FMN-binding protein [Betaproteobacteria bacterium]